ncbi:hypothetical protein Tco_1238242 [Tanacetum coccineum]
MMSHVCDDASHGEEIAYASGNKWADDSKVGCLQGHDMHGTVPGRGDKDETMRARTSTAGEYFVADKEDDGQYYSMVWNYGVRISAVPIELERGAVLVRTYQAGSGARRSCDYGIHVLALNCSGRDM